jgi:poly-beta-1,6-N-acetyl-D-glucosamine biosynthesis protein PgaD
MEESRQRPPYPEVIDEPGLKTKKRVFWESLVTLSFAGVVLYLLGFIITFLLWVFGYHLMHLEIYELGNQEMLRLFKNAGWITACVVLVTLCWSYYNLLIFKIRGERRGRRVAVCFDKDLADFFKIDVEVLEKAKNYPRLSVLQKEGTIIFKEIGP